MTHPVASCLNRIVKCLNKGAMAVVVVVVHLLNLYRETGMKVLHQVVQVRRTAALEDRIARLHPLFPQVTDPQNPRRQTCTRPLGPI